MSPRPIKATFEGTDGATLSARVDLPAGPVKGYALFAHCFTCSKDIAAARVVASALTEGGFGVMRFDFTGLGGSGGDFASTNFTMNLEDLKRAAAFLATHYAAPSLLIGHSLGGAAVLAVAADIPGIKAVATLNAPADTTHVTAHFGAALETIRAEGAAEVSLGNRPFRIEKQFLDDLDQHDVETRVAALHKPLLVLHAPSDLTVGVEHAARIFGAAKHPKSFVSLDTADHLLSRQADAAYAAQVITAWASRYVGLDDASAHPAETEADVVVRETAQGKFQSLVTAGPHRLIADEPVSYGGFGSGPSPYEYLSAALGACTVMTIRMYADRKNLDLGPVTCAVSHEKRHEQSMNDAMEGMPKKDHFTRTIDIGTDLPEDVAVRVMEIADRCPVHRTLENGAAIITERKTS